MGCRNLWECFLLMSEIASEIIDAVSVVCD